MKYPSSQEDSQEDESGGRGNCEKYPLVTLRQKRLKVEPLSPPSVYSDDEEDEESSLSSWSDQELSQTLLTKIQEANVQTQSVEQTELTEREDSKSQASEGDNLTDDDCEEDSEAEHATPTRKQARIPTRLTPSKRAMVASTITSTTPPQTPAPQESETAIPDTTNLSDADDETNQSQYYGNNSNSTHENYYQQRREQQPEVYRSNHLSSPISRVSRGENTKLSEEQHERLKKIFRVIEEGHYEELKRLLEEREGAGNLKRNILNVFVKGDTALHRALRLGRGLAWCKLLVDNGANPTLTNQAGWHPIHLAAHNGTRDTMSYIISFADSV